MLLILLIFITSINAYNHSSLERIAWLTGNLHRFSTQDSCPPCFNCLLPEFPCENFGECQTDNGRCINCPVGFGGDNCGVPLCNRLGDPSRQPPSLPESPCKCDKDWTGMNCNVCKNNQACSRLGQFKGTNTTCYKGGIVVNQLFRSCEANLGSFYGKILKGKKISVTMDYQRDKKDPNINTISFQAWLDSEEGFYCQGIDCTRDSALILDQESTNITYSCPKLSCKCVSHASICDPKQLLDLTPILKQIKGPSSITCNENGTHCLIQEPQLNLYFSGGMILDCDSGECMRTTQVPGHEIPHKRVSFGNLALIIFAVLVLLSSMIYGCLFLLKQQADMMDNRGLSITSLTPEEETRLFMETHIPAKVVFKNLSYHIGSQLILNSVNGGVLPGQVLAIMGGSGAGKTSLLDILAGKRKKGTVYGDILINGAQLLPREYRAMCGFVDQEDTLLDTLTVRETLTYSAMLRLPRTMSIDAKKLRVQQTMEELAIDHLADRLVGKSDVRGISGGEKRRLSIAQELVTSPSILFLDEPTSGLDSYNAYHVMKSLVRVARRFNRTIICTIHQPRSDIFALFDSLLLLSCGQMIYSGKILEIPSYLESIELPCPMGYNMADHLLDITLNIEDETFDGLGDDIEDDDSDIIIGGSRSLVDSTIKWFKGQIRSLHKYQSDVSFNHPNRISLLEHKAQLLSRNFTTSAFGQRFLSQIDQESSVNAIASPRRFSSTDNITGGGENTNQSAPSVIMPVLSSGLPSETSFAQSEEDEQSQLIGGMNIEEKIQSKIPFMDQVRILSGRTLINLYRNPNLLFAHYGLSILLALFCGLLFFQITNDMPGVQNRLGCLFFICAFFGFGSMTSLEFFASERVLFIRERSNGYYSLAAYYISKILFDLIPLRTVPPILFGSIVYYLIGLYPTLGAFLRFIICLVLFNLVSAAICLVIAVLFRHSAIGNLTASLIMLFSMLFGGFLLNKDRMLFIVSWIKYLSAFNYAYEALLVNELKDLQVHDDTIVDIDVPGVLILQQMGFDPHGFWKDIMMLFLMFSICVLSAYLILRIFVKEKK